MAVHRPDILIIGAGVLGSAAAWHLSERRAGDITVIDLDLAGTYSSSELNAGGCRATWWNPINVQLSWHAMKFYETVAEEVQFFQKGYLFLHNQTRWRIALEKRSLYEGMGIPVNYLTPADIADHLPEFENLKGVAGATYSPRDGLIDPHLLKEYYQARAKANGVRFLDRVYVEKMVCSGKRIQRVEGQKWEAPSSPGEELIEEILTGHRIRDPGPWKETAFEPGEVVNCTGAWLPVTSRLYQIPSPVKPVRRQISLFSSHEEDFSDRGMMVDSSGLYMHPEGAHTGLVLSGYSNRDEKPGYRFEYDGEKFFNRKIWLRLYRRGNRKHFEAIKHVRGWSGLYAVGPDNMGILWRVTGFDNLYELGAATGRGVMQSFSLGLALAELITNNKFETIDASRLTGSRFDTNRLEVEGLDI